ncbi:aminopeptidase [Salibacteraceae bacterium]|nr:aminopeptidase [Flavobacteriales bacterium]MDB9701556.1 aminopeptidase [Salibacteraceae bacterium]
MKRFATFLIAMSSLTSLNAQYTFVEEKKLECTEVKSQDNTGTCWSFSTSSFIESELLRMGKGNQDLSEMYIVRNIYRDKARNYILRQGTSNFSQGALAHDLIRMMGQVGLMFESDYSGLVGEDSTHNHSEMESALKGYLDGVRKSKNVSDKWMAGFDGILDAYLGPLPAGKDPQKLAASFGIKASDYVSYTSFTHHPFDAPFILELPDNYSNGSFNNVPLDDLMKIIDEALANGYSLAWDGDVSEKGFAARSGLAIVPKDPKRDSLMTIPGEELIVSQELRQEQFERLKTTDDHLMHMIGTAEDENGTKYYIIKNSWGAISDFDGFLYMSESYVRLKTVGILLHKDGVPKKL